jgi:serine/threonine protein kinase
LKKEASITASINHPNVVKVYTVGQDRGLVYIVMELVDKGSLDDLMTLQGRVAEAQVLEIGIGIAKGLNAALQKGLIHRDIKPGNILFADAHTAKIVDFGLAVLQEHASTVAGEVWGTPYYVAPEKLDNQPEDFRSDMYSLGGTLFHALAGRPPFEAETASMVALKHIKSQVVSLQAFAPDVSSSTAYVINKTLAKEPAIVTRVTTSWSNISITRVPRWWRN